MVPIKRRRNHLIATLPVKMLRNSCSTWDARSNMSLACLALTLSGRTWGSFCSLKREEMQCGTVNIFDGFAVDGMDQQLMC